jgi:hypothetical protein
VIFSFEHDDEDENENDPLFSRVTRHASSLLTSPPQGRMLGLRERKDLNMSRPAMWRHSRPPARAGLWSLLFCLGAMSLAGSASAAEGRPGDRPARAAAAVRIAERLLKLPPDHIKARQQCIDELAELEEDALPGLERILHGHLSRSLGGTREQDGRVVDLILGRFTAPREPWEPDALAFQVDYGETHEEAMKRAVRRPWLRPFLLKVLKHHFTSQRRFFLWGVWYHLKDPVPDLCDFARADPDPSVRANALILLTKVSPLPREGILSNVVYGVAWVRRLPFGLRR